MKMRIRIREANGKLLEDWEIGLSERTTAFLKSNVNFKESPQISVEVIWDPEFILDTPIPPRP